VTITVTYDLHDMGWTTRFQFLIGIFLFWNMAWLTIVPISGAHSPEINQAECENDHSPPSHVKFKNVGLYLHSFTHPHGVVFRHGNNFYSWYFGKLWLKLS